MKQVLLLLPPGAELLEAAVFTDIFGWDAVAGSKECCLISAGAQKPQAAAFGQSIMPQVLAADIDPRNFAALALPGGFPRYGFFDCLENKDFRRIAEHFIKEDKPVAAICTGVLLLARWDLLKGRTAAIYAQEKGRWQQQLQQQGAKLAAEPCWIDKNLISAQSPAYAHWAALKLLAMLTDEHNACRTAEMMDWDNYGLDNYRKEKQ